MNLSKVCGKNNFSYLLILNKIIIPNAVKLLFAFAFCMRRHRGSYHL